MEEVIDSNDFQIFQSVFVHCSFQLDEVLNERRQELRQQHQKELTRLRDDHTEQLKKLRDEYKDKVKYQFSSHSHVFPHCYRIYK